MNIDWVSRLKNKSFLLALASFIALTAKTFNLFEVPANYNDIVNALLTVLTFGGVIIDPSTPGISDGDKGGN